MTDIFRKTIADNLAGRGVALPSICSAHPDVLEASLLLAKQLKRPIIIEATSNQVNQFGGYTGMQPRDFVSFVHQIADTVGFDRNQIIFGGDHLGPQVWRARPEGPAMACAETLVEEYVRAGFTKIHLDCSEGCAGEPAQVDDKTSAERAARLAAICERVAPDPEKLSYIVGTEVPPPGGAHEDEKTVIQPTKPANAKTTLLAHYEAFDAAGIPQAKQRIRALVVQPGVEFSPADVHHLPKGGNAELRAVLDEFDGVCFEAHSTDYQHPDAYSDLARMGFAIHKVGPALTFAYRQAIYALDMLRDFIEGPSRTAQKVADIMEELMLQNPASWASHYHGDAGVIALLRHFSYADRIRYYWAIPAAQTAVKELLGAIDSANIPPPVWTQFFGSETLARAEMLTQSGYGPAKSRILAEIQVALMPYFFTAESRGAK